MSVEELNKNYKIYSNQKYIRGKTIVNDGLEEIQLRKLKEEEDKRLKQEAIIQKEK
jgi:hypothetical protein